MYVDGSFQDVLLENWSVLLILDFSSVKIIKTFSNNINDASVWTIPIGRCQKI